MILERENTAALAFLAALERNVSKQAFETWFRPLRVTRARREGSLRIFVPNTLARDWIVTKYSDALELSLRESNLSVKEVEWAVPDADENRQVDSAEHPTQLSEKEAQ